MSYFRGASRDGRDRRRKWQIRLQRRCARPFCLTQTVAMDARHWSYRLRIVEKIQEITGYSQTARWSSVLATATLACRRGSGRPLVVSADWDFARRKLQPRWLSLSRWKRNVGKEEARLGPRHGGGPLIREWSGWYSSR
jgi:hypothetical protein